MYNCFLIIIIYCLFYCVGTILFNSCDKQLDASVNNVAIPSNYDEPSFNSLATVLSTVSMVLPQQSGKNIKRGREPPKIIQIAIYL